MAPMVMDLEQLASYLQRDLREVTKWANRGHLPGQKVGGRWRFSTAEIDRWLESRLHELTDRQLEALEQRHSSIRADDDLVVSNLLSESTTHVQLTAGTRSSLLRELVELAEGTWQIYDAPALLEAVRQREEMGSTALAGGVAFPHPHHPLSPKAQGDSVVALGRASRGIPFGAPDGGLTDLFFLVCCRDAALHLRVLARLSRLVLRARFLEVLREAETSADMLRAIEDYERELVA